MDREVKITIVETSRYVGMGIIRQTYYFMNGKRISENRYYQWRVFCEEHYKWLGSRYESKRVGNINRDYTYELFEEK